MSNSRIDFYYNGKLVKNKKDIPKGAIHIWTHYEHKVYYGDKDHKAKQDKATSDFFQRQREYREDQEKFH